MTGARPIRYADSPMPTRPVTLSLDTAARSPIAEHLLRRCADLPAAGQ
jgi:hypothetical protein